jgi:molybdate transport system substrate-binding protein
MHRSPHRWIRAGFASAILTGSAMAPRAAAAADLQVFAAASLTDALRDIGQAYGAETGQRIVPNLASSSTLARQITEGAPADVFLSADEASMDRLEQAKLLLAGTRSSPLSNTLVVVVPVDSNLAIATPADLVAPGLRALALAEPQTVPAGVYAKTWLTSLDLWQKVVHRVVPTENVRAALSAVESGNADAAIVYRTDAKISKKVRVAYEVKRGDGPPISYAFAALREAKDPEGARRFVAYLAGAKAREIFTAYGFLVPDAKP